MGLTRQEVRQRSSQLRALICEWDPIGVMDDPDWPRDEYDCLVGPLLTLLQSGATSAAIADHLRKELVEHFGLSPEHYDFLRVAGRIWKWFDRAWRNSAEPVTIFVALLGEGVEAWRPVQARPLEGSELFRIMGVEGDVSHETWQFPGGAIVRCELRRFADGKSGITAVTEVGEAG